MVMEPEDPMSEPRGRSWVEVWLFVAVSLVGLLGFMSSLSTGDVQEVAGSENSKAAIYAQQKLEEFK
jgi:beta-lactam-binding protein with PASTA domain